MRTHGLTQPGRQAGRLGYSLVEVLTVTAILAVVVGLTLAAIQKVRTAAARAQCADHLRQQCLGWQLHHNQHGFYPTRGGSGDGPVTFASPGDPALGGPGDGGQAAGWQYQILPFVGQEVLWRQSGVTDQMQANRQILATPVTIYFCPGRDRPRTWKLHTEADLPYDQECPDRAGSDYTANGGRKPPPDPLLRWLPADTGGVYAVQEGTGRQIVPRRLTTADFPDGLSSTLFLGEIYLPLEHRSFDRFSRNGGYIGPGGYAMVTTVDESRQPRPPILDTTPPPVGAFQPGGFGSSHPSGMNAALGDGSVRTVPYTIDPQVWLRLGVRNDGQPVGDF
jgi:hypothetical protein